MGLLASLTADSALCYTCVYYQDLLTNYVDINSQPLKMYPYLPIPFGHGLPSLSFRKKLISHFLYFHPFFKCIAGAIATFPPQMISNCTQSPPSKNSISFFNIIAPALHCSTPSSTDTTARGLVAFPPKGGPNPHT